MHLMAYSPFGSLDQSNAIPDYLFPFIPFSIDVGQLLIFAVETLLSLRIEFSLLPQFICKCLDDYVAGTRSSGFSFGDPLSGSP